MSVRRSVGLVAGVALLVGLAMLFSRPKVDELAFLAVGQGDCIVFRSAGKTVLVDVGPAASAERIVVSELRSRGIGRVDLVLLSHPDADHIAALPALARRIRIGQVVIPSYFRDHLDMVHTLAEAGIGKDRLSLLAGPSEAKIGAFVVHMDVPPWETGIPDNDGSMAVRISSGGASVTLTGDGGVLEEVELMHKGSWSSQILKLGHHGSRFSSGDSWLDHVHPEVAIVSCGRDNMYGHPAAETLERCRARGIPVRRTDREGTLAFRLVDGKWVLNGEP